MDKERERERQRGGTHSPASEPRDLESDLFSSRGEKNSRQDLPLIFPCKTLNCTTAEFSERDVSVYQKNLNSRIPGDILFIPESDRTVSMNNKVKDKLLQDGN